MIKFLPKKYYCLVGTTIAILFVSCFPPYGYFDKSRESTIVFYDIARNRIEKRGEEEDVGRVISITIYAHYDTITIINGKPSDGYELFEKKGNIVFPFILDSIIRDRSKEVTISLPTDKPGNSFSLRVKKTDWLKSYMFFTSYYRP